MNPQARIVLYEPDNSTHELLRDLLDARGCSVLALDDLERAAAVRCQSTVDILICSVAGRDDIDRVGAIRDRAVPMIAVTPEGQSGDTAMFGIEFAVEKPVDPSEFNRRLTECLPLRQRYLLREEIKQAFGETVMCAVEAALGDDAPRRGDYADLLNEAREAFPNTSIHELAGAMLEGIRERA